MYAMRRLPNPIILELQQVATTHRASVTERPLVLPLASVEAPCGPNRPSAGLCSYPVCSCDAPQDARSWRGNGRLRVWHQKGH
jgi:hypothetical protein